MNNNPVETQNLASLQMTDGVRVCSPPFTGLINKSLGQALLFCLARRKSADALYKKAKGKI